MLINIAFLVTSLVLTWLVFGLITGAALRKWLGARETGLSPIMVTTIGLGIGPLLTSWLLYLEFSIVPGVSTLPCVGSICAVFAWLAFYARKEFRPLIGELQSQIQEIWTQIRKLTVDWLLLVALCGCILGYIVYQATAYPIVSHDGSVYAFLGEYLASEKSMANYPMTQPDRRTGARMTLEHPPAVPLVYAWFHLFGEASGSLGPRTVSAMYSLFIVLILGELLRVRKNLRAAVLGVLLTLLVPAFVWQSFDNSIDPPRMFLFLASLAMLAASVSARREFHLVSFVGMCAGLAAFVHASGILIALVLGLVVAVRYLSTIRLSTIRLSTIRFPAFIARSAFVCIVFSVTASCFGATQYVRNHATFGNILGPQAQELFNPNVANFYSETELAHRNQNGQMKKLIFGRLQVISRPELFGVSFWVFLAALCFWLRGRDKQNADFILLLGLVLFALPVLYKYYSNRRYILTVLPSAAFFGGLIFADLYERLKANRIVLWGSMSCAAAVVAIAFCLPNSILRHKLKEGTSPFQFIFASKLAQNRSIDGGIHEATKFVNDNTSRDSVVLVADERFYIDSQRKGRLIGGMNRLSELNKLCCGFDYMKYDTDGDGRLSEAERIPAREQSIEPLDKHDVKQILARYNISYVLLNEQYAEIASRSPIGQLLQDTAQCQLVHDGESKVWHVLGSSRSIAAKEPRQSHVK